MKTFKQYITEVDKPKQIDSEDKWHLIDALNLVKKDCQQFLHKAATNGKFHPIYRGLTKSPWPKYEVKVRHSPKNESTDKEIRDTIREVFTDKFGRAFGSDAILCSGDPTMVDGIKHLIFPIGKFDFLWAEKIKDLNSSLGHNEQEGELYFDMHNTEKSKDKIVKAFIKDNEFVHNKDLILCADKGHELMIECKYFYAIPTSQILEHFEVFKKMIGDLHFKKSLKSDLS